MIKSLMREIGSAYWPSMVVTKPFPGHRLRAPEYINLSGSPLGRRSQARLLVKPQ